MDEYRKPYILFLAGVFVNDIGEPEISIAEKSEKIIFQESPSGPVDPDIGFDSDLDHEHEPETILITSKQDTSDQIQNYNDIPKYFSNKKSWPTTTNLLCWNCSNRVPGIPWFVPLAWIKKVFVNDMELENQVYFNTGVEEEASEISDSSLLTNGQTVKEEKVFISHGNFCSPLCVKRYIKYNKDPKITNIWESIRLLGLLYREMTNTNCKEIPEAEDCRTMSKFCGPGGLSEKQYCELNESKAAKFRIVLKSD